MYLVQPNQESTSEFVEKSTFVRLEQKFLLSKTLWPQLNELLNAYSAPCYPDSETDFNLIESVYFDSPELKIYNDHFSAPLSRFKVRTRRYAPNGIWKTKSVFMEVKRKEDGVTKKERMKVPVEQIALLTNGVALGLSERMIKKNKRDSIQTLHERIDMVNGLFETYSLKPQARVVYQRRAFEKNDFRITVDDDLNYEVLRDVSEEVSTRVKCKDFWFKAQQMRNSYEQDRVFVLELKYSEKIPDWMTGFLVGANVQRVQFSKYCFAVTNTISERGFK